MKLARKSSRKVFLSLTSLIDVLFILIIFFTVSSTFLEQPGIELKLPDAESSETHTTQKNVIYVDHQSQIFVNDDLIPIDSLTSKVSELLTVSDDKSVVLRADKEVTHGAIIRIMDMLRREGIYKIIVSTNKPAVKKN